MREPPCLIPLVSPPLLQEEHEKSSVDGANSQETTQEKSSFPALGSSETSRKTSSLFNFDTFLKGNSPKRHILISDLECLVGFSGEDGSFIVDKMEYASFQITHTSTLAGQ